MTSFFIRSLLHSAFDNHWDQIESTYHPLLEMALLHITSLTFLRLLQIFRHQVCLHVRLVTHLTFTTSVKAKNTETIFSFSKIKEITPLVSLNRVLYGSSNFLLFEGSHLCLKSLLRSGDLLRDINVQTYFILKVCNLFHPKKIDPALKVVNLPNINKEEFLPFVLTGLNREERQVQAID